jgi:Phage tail lysozyme
MTAKPCPQSDGASDPAISEKPFVGTGPNKWIPSQDIRLSSAYGETGPGYFITLGTHDYVTSFPGKGPTGAWGATGGFGGKDVLGVGNPTGASYIDEHNNWAFDGHTHPGIDNDIAQLATFSVPPGASSTVDPDTGAVIPPSEALTSGYMRDVLIDAFFLLAKKLQVQLVGNKGDEATATMDVTQDPEHGFQISPDGDDTHHLTGDQCFVAYVSGASNNRGFVYYNKKKAAFFAVEVLTVAEDRREQASANDSNSEDESTVSENGKTNIPAGGNISVTPNQLIIYKQPKRKGTNKLISNEKYIWKTLLTNGYTKKQAAGILGNLEQEANFDPELNDPMSAQGQGIVQWSLKGRWQSLLSWINSNSELKGKERTLERQVEYMLREMKKIGNAAGGAPLYNDATFKATKTVQSAAHYFDDTFEVSGLKGPRFSYADKWYDNFKSVSGWDKPSNFTTGGTSGSRATTEADQKGPQTFSVISGTVTIAVYYKETLGPNAPTNARLLTHRNPPTSYYKDLLNAYKPPEVPL